MIELLRGFFRYWGDVFALIGAALAPSAALFAAILEQAEAAAPVALGVSFVAGVSLLLGQSVILFLNRVGPLRFLLSLLLHGLVITSGLLVTAILYGSQDGVQRLGAYAFPRRWPIFKDSFWNRALAEGRIELIEIGPYKHNVEQHYFDREWRLPNGETYMGHVVSEIGRLLREAGLEVAR